MGNGNMFTVAKVTNWGMISARSSKADVCSKLKLMTWTRGERLNAGLTEHSVELCLLEFFMVIYHYRVQST